MEPRKNSPIAPTPLRTHAGTPPHSVALTLCALALAGLTACASDDGDQVTSPVVVGMTDSIAPLYNDGQTAIYQAQTPVTLPMRQPTDLELKSVTDAEPYPRGPWIFPSDVRIEVRYTLSNLDADSHNVELLLDPWNEFVHWVPGVQIVDEDSVVPNFSGYDKLIVVPGKSRVVGTITPDDMTELAIDLATAEAIMAKPPQRQDISVAAMLNHVFDLQNRSNDGDPLITPFIPKVIDGLTGFDLGIRTYTKANVAVEIVIDVTDLQGNRVIHPDKHDDPIGEPGTALTPPASNGM